MLIIEYQCIKNLVNKSRIIAAAVHKGTGGQTNNPTCSFKIGDMNLFVKNVD